MNHVSSNGSNCVGPSRVARSTPLPRPWLCPDQCGNPDHMIMVSGLCSIRSPPISAPFVAFRSRHLRLWGSLNSKKIQGSIVYSIIGERTNHSPFSDGVGRETSYNLVLDSLAGIRACEWCREEWAWRVHGDQFRYVMDQKTTENELCCHERDRTYQTTGDGNFFRAFPGGISGMNTMPTWCLQIDIGKRPGPRFLSS